MQDKHPMLCVLALLLPLAGLIALGCIHSGDVMKDALFAAMKLVVIR